MHGFKFFLPGHYLFFQMEQNKFFTGYYLSILDGRKYLQSSLDSKKTRWVLLPTLVHRSYRSISHEHQQKKAHLSRFCYEPGLKALHVAAVWTPTGTKGNFMIFFLIFLIFPDFQISELFYNLISNHPSSLLNLTSNL